MCSVPQVSDVLHRYASTLLDIENAQVLICPLCNDVNVRIVPCPQTCYSHAKGTHRITDLYIKDDKIILLFYSVKSLPAMLRSLGFECRSFSLNECNKFL